MSIRCENISKQFRRTGLVTLQEINFETRPNEFVALLGPSGCGKTTLLKIMAGIEQPTQGRVIFASHHKNRPNAAMVFQDHDVFPWLTVQQNILFGLSSLGLPRKERYRRTHDLIHRVKLTGFEHYYPSQLSGGMRQRIGIARAFAADTEVLLMDEPFGALDAQTKLLMQSELLEIWSETHKTVLYVTHDIDEALLLADRIIVFTQRPARIYQILDVNLPRPRHLHDVDKPEIRELRWLIWNWLVNPSSSVQP